MTPVRYKSTVKTVLITRCVIYNNEIYAIKIQYIQSINSPLWTADTEWEKLLLEIPEVVMLTTSGASITIGSCFGYVYIFVSVFLTLRNAVIQLSIPPTLLRHILNWYYILVYCARRIDALIMSESDRYRPDAVGIGTIQARFWHIIVCLYGCISSEYFTWCRPQRPVTGSM